MVLYKKLWPASSSSDLESDCISLAGAAGSSWDQLLSEISEASESESSWFYFFGPSSSLLSVMLESSGSLWGFSSLNF
jgi:hypothetical protein